MTGATVRPVAAGGPERRIFNRLAVLAATGAVACVGVLAACSSGAPAASGAGVSPASRPPAAHAAAAPRTVWLCEPGHLPDPCTASLDATSVSGSGVLRYQPAAPAKSPKADCFYVYPTASPEKTINSDLTIQPAERSVARQEASRFSTVCRVWAPMYRQVTLKGLQAGDAVIPKYVHIALSSLESAFEDYLTHYNDGRPIVFIGHSQGAAMLILMLEQKVDDDPALRGRMLSAVLLGGNVEVRKGRLVGGSFEHIPACTSRSELHCVLAYSSFLTQPPADSLFGIPGQGVSLQSFQTRRRGLEVVCTNPADLSGGRQESAPLSPYFRGGPPGLHGSAWYTFPGLYRAGCRTKGDATWLQVTPTPAKGDKRPIVTQSLGPTWGLHLYDVDLALGDLVADVRAEIAAYHG